MNILITGNLGYVGSELTTYLKKKDKNINIYGLDIGFFKKNITMNKKDKIKKQYICDIRNFKSKYIKNIDTVVHLAAISNDPIGNMFKKQTYDINVKATKKLIEYCSNFKVKNFIFASSCSVYGFTNRICGEKSQTKPLTAYAKSKVIVENYLQKNFKYNSTCLRFATACGGSKRLRIDLVLNDFVASAIKKKKIILNSTGEAFRPLIDVHDMCKAILWSIKERNLIKKRFLCLNVGNSKNNFKIIDLAKKVRRKFKNMKIITNNKNKDNRSYKASFSKYENLAKNYPINYSVNKSIISLNKILKKYPKKKYNTLVRLNYLKNLIKQNIISKNLK